MTQENNQPNQFKIHLFQWQEQLTLTLQKLILLLALIIFLILILILIPFWNIHSFLAITSPLDADLLIVEGWMSDEAIKSAIAEFNRGAYQKLITTGSPIGKGYYLSEYKNFADLSAATLKVLGFDENKLIAIPTPQVIKYRTAASAMAVKEWLATSDFKVNSINIYTFGLHARRSWIVYKNVFSPDIKVGVIAIEPKSYDANKWWESSGGVRNVIGEAIAYFYTRFIDWKS